MQIHYPKELDSLAFFEIESKGWLSGVIIELANGSRHNVTFYDPIRLSQDLESELASGKSSLIEQGLIIIPVVTKTNIEKAIIQAIEENFFHSQ